MRKSTVLSALILLPLILASCDYFPGFFPLEETPSTIPEALAANAKEPAEYMALPKEPETDFYDLYIETEGIRLSKYEPEKGCYTGAYIKEDIMFDGNIEEFEKFTEVSNAFYAHSIRIGEEYPYSFVYECLKNMKTPVLIIEPPEEGNPFDEIKMIKTAGAIGSIKIPIIVVFYPITQSSNFDVNGYIEFFRKAYEYFSELADNAAIVWSIPHYDIQNKNSFFPGDSYVDWVGISVLSDIKNSEDEESVYDDIYEKIDHMYYLYQKTKPIFLTVAISHYSTLDNVYYTEKASKTISELYKKLENCYPRIKSVLYLDINNVDSDSKKGNNYLLTEDDTIISAYKNALNTSYFLKEIVADKNGVEVSQIIKSPFKAIKSEDKYYIAKNSVDFDFTAQQKRKVFGQIHSFDFTEYYDAAQLLPVMNLDLFEDVENKGFYITKNR